MTEDEMVTLLKASNLVETLLRSKTVPQGFKPRLFIAGEALRTAWNDLQTGNYKVGPTGGKLTDQILSSE